MKVFLWGVLTVLFTIPVFGQLKPNIAIVRPQLDPTLKEDFGKLQRYFEERNVDSLAAYFQALAEGGSFGSGFILRKTASSALVMTNRHVVATAKTVSVEFEQEGGTTRKYDDCQVVWIDDKVDLALVVVNGSHLPQALNLATRLPGDGEEVWSAGFPGLLGRPSWQLAKGNVTNRNVVVEELGPSSDAVFVQHSAPISPGNSGGPLMIGSPSNLAAIRVIGVNTWTAGGRENTFFAVPLSKINQTLSLYNASLAITSTALPLQKLQEFRDFLAAPEWNPTAFQGLISNQAGLRQGWPLFEDDLRTMPTNQRDQWIREFVSQPIEALRKYLSLALYESVKEERGTLSDFQAQASENTIQPIYNLILGEKKLEFTWEKVGGSWKLAQIILPQPSAVAANPVNRTNSDTERKIADNSFYPSGFNMGFGFSFTNYINLDSTLIDKPLPLGFGFRLGLTMPLTRPFLGLDIVLETIRLLPNTTYAWEFISLEAGPNFRLTDKDAETSKYASLFLSLRGLVGFPNVLSFSSKSYGNTVLGGIGEIGVEVKDTSIPWGITIGASKTSDKNSGIAFYSHLCLKIPIR